MGMRVVALLATLIAAASAYADQEASNTTHVAASEYGRCYAKSVPTERYGAKGTTLVWQVSDAQDTLVHSYDWFSQRIHLACNVSDGLTPVGISVVRFGPWARGRAASREHFAIGFYFKGKKLKEYSTLDIAGDPENVSASVSHYTVIEEVLGYRWLEGNKAVFEVKTNDGRTLSFDAATGGLL